ncbi:MAG: hypothetical protein U9P49_06340 [Thermodesulfobacteriota bacterium]|nr:hypothetical protein [Thermodesulfobacteriota bacterium]
MELAHNLVDWACSYSGCDGGNPKAEIWICGIEWGFAKEKRWDNETYEKKLNEYYKKELPEEISKGGDIPLKDKYYIRENLDYPYGINVAKLYSAIIGEKVGKYRDVAEKSKGSEIFRMNLYPIAFRNTDENFWKGYELDKLTGFEEKHLFKTWCFLNRFPAIAKKIKNMSN